MNRRQWGITVGTLLLIGVTALFPRDIYGRLYPFYARSWQYDPWPHLLCWFALLSAGGLLLWVNSLRGKQVSLLRRIIALCGAATLIIIGFVPPDAHFFFARFAQINSELWGLRLLVVLLMMLCWLWVVDKRSRWGKAQRLVMGILTVGMLVFPHVIHTRLDEDFFMAGFIYMPPALLIVLLMGLADLADSRRKAPAQDR